MIKLDTTTRKIQAVLSGAVTANQLPCTVSYSDDNGTTYVGGTQLTNTNSTTAVDICAAPGASTVRDIDYLSIRNRDTAAATVTVMLDDNGTDYEIVKATLAVGDQLVYTHSDGWRALDANGNAKTSLSGATESQVQNSTLITLTSVSGTDTITAGAPDPFTAYADGQEFSFIAAGTNTGAATLNIDSVGAIDVKKQGGIALAAGDITIGAFVKVKYVSATGDFEMLGGASRVTAPAGSAALPSVSTTGDLNTGMWFPAADTIAWSTGGVERLRIDSSGNVGIGVTDFSVSGANAKFAVSGGVVNFDNDQAIAWGGGTGRPGVTGSKATGILTLIGTNGVICTQESGLGYGTGAGGTVTQATSRTTGVTLNKPTGAITLVSAAGSTSWQSFTVANSIVSATDVVHVCQKSGTDLNEIHVTAVVSGSFNVSFRTTGGTTTEQPVFNFSVIKGATS